MKLLTIVGARPQFIKAVPLLNAIAQHNAPNKLNELNKPNEPKQPPITPLLLHTGQHYDVELSRIFFDELGIPQPDDNLGIASDTHARQTGRAMMAIEDTLLAERPDLVLVYGDTNSTLAGALAAVKLHIPVAHVEAGPRMFDRSVPEEVNRVLTDHVSSLLFAPTQISVDNLKKEGITEGVHLTGDVMLDSFLFFSRIAAERSDILDRLGLTKGRYLLATVHRARNTDSAENLRSIIEAFSEIDEQIVFPLHPRTRNRLEQLGLLPPSPTPNHHSPLTIHQLLITAPVGYLDSLALTGNAGKVLTDSGGLQKEAYFAKVPCITLDDATGWPETVDDGWNVLVGSDRARIIDAARHFEPQGEQRSLFGDGHAAQQIVEILTRSC